MGNLGGIFVPSWPPLGPLVGRLENLSGRPTLCGVAISVAGVPGAGVPGAKSAIAKLPSESPPTSEHGSDTSLDVRRILESSSDEDDVDTAAEDELCSTSRGCTGAGGCHFL